jgi:hypothetical protein
MFGSWGIVIGPMRMIVTTSDIYLVVHTSVELHGGNKGLATSAAE